jgi:hypothetical protein
LTNVSRACRLSWKERAVGINVKTGIRAVNRMAPEKVELRTDPWNHDVGIVVSDGGVYVHLEDFPKLIDAMVKFYSDVKADLAAKAAVEEHRKATCS